MPIGPGSGDEGGADDNDLPVSRPPTAIVAVTTAARGGVFWLVVAALLARRPGPWRRGAREGLVSAGCAMAAGHVVKGLVRRGRPPTRRLPARRALPERPSSYAFPSTHAAAAAAFAVGVGLEAPAAGAAVTPLAALVCYGRLRTWVHWPTDVYGGVALGVAIACARRRYRER